MLYPNVLMPLGRVFSPIILKYQESVRKERAEYREGDEVQLTITTQYGSQTQYVVNVPESLQDKQAVSL